MATQPLLETGQSAFPLLQPGESAFKEQSLPIIGEPSVVSSVSGEQKYQTKIQPKIDAANQVITDSQRAAKEGEAKRVTDAALMQETALPPEVQAEVDAGLTDEQKAEKLQIDSWKKQEDDAKKAAAALSLAFDNSAKAEIGIATNSWGERRALLEQSNKQNLSSWRQQFIRSGQEEYSPGMTSNFLTQKEQEGLAKLREVDNEYRQTVAKINAATGEKKYALAAGLTNTLAGLQDKAAKLAADNAKEAKAVNDKMRESITKASRESAIGNLITQYKITDPIQLQDLLNNDESGNQHGDISLDEIDKVMKIMGKDESLTGLSSDYRTYKYLSDNKDPAVKGLSYFEYLNAVGNASRKGETPKSDDISLSNVDRQKLLGSGISQPTIGLIESDVNSYGIDKVLEGITDPRQKRALQEVYGAEDTKEFLTAEYFSKLFTDDQLKTAASEAGYRHLTSSWATEKQNYLDSLENMVKQYREAGYSDKEILKMMQ